MDNIFYDKADLNEEISKKDCRKPYSKWTISSTNWRIKNEHKNGNGRKPYSKWTISSTIMHKEEFVRFTNVVNLILNGQYLLPVFLQ